MTYDETVRLTALGNRYRELTLEADRVQRDLGEVSSRKRELEKRLHDLNVEMSQTVSAVEPIFAGSLPKEPPPIVVSAVAPREAAA